MRSYSRIAGIMLGAFALGMVVVIGWTAIISEAVDLGDRVRRARCAWVDTLVVSVSGHELSIAATPGTTVNTGMRWISGEEVSGYRVEPARFGFCLDARPSGALPVRSVTMALDTARASAAQTGLPMVGGPVLEIGESALFLPDAPAPVGQNSEMTVFYRNEDFGWPRMVTQGITRDGFRIGAVCRDVAGGGWLCDVSVHDARLDLSYRFEQLPVEVAAFDAAPVPPAFVAVAQGMRALRRLLEAEAVARN